MKAFRWWLARRVYRSPFPALWSGVAPRWTADELADIRAWAVERAEHLQRKFEQADAERTRTERMPTEPPAVLRCETTLPHQAHTLILHRSPWVATCPGVKEAER